MRAHRGFFLSLAVVGLACGQRPGGASRDSSEVAARAARLERKLVNAAAAPGGSAPLAQWVLPADFGEVSGIALTPDGRLLAHNDEQGMIAALDPRRGVLLKRFAIGNNGKMVRADFEGITIANGRIYLLASNGTLYEFQEGRDGEYVPFSTLDTQLGHECEFEGVAYDAGRQELLLPCKNVGTKRLRDQLVIYRWSLQPAPSARTSVLTIPLARVIGANRWKGVHPTDITIDAATGNYILVASREKALIEITPNGDVVRAMPLPPGHDQAEGIALSPDGFVVVSDEATQRPASITLYRWPLTAASPGQL